jgi:hypothetical protein
VVQSRTRARRRGGGAARPDRRRVNQSAHRCAVLTGMDQ